MVQNASRAAFPGAFFVLNVLLLLAVGAYIGRDTLLPRTTRAPPCFCWSRWPDTRPSTCSRPGC